MGLSQILGPQDPGHGQHTFSSTGGLLEPLQWLSVEEEFLEEGCSVQQHQWPVCSLPMASSSTIGSPGWYLFWELYP